MQINEFQTESQSTDYTSIVGVKTRTGISDNKSFGRFIVKELMDNALDHMEKNTKINPYVNVTITEKDGITNIKIRNSINTDDQSIFSKEQIENIFNLEQYASTKRHQHIIKRGALGDGLKECLCIPYAFAVDNWDYPLIINLSNQKLFEVKITNISQVKRNPKLTPEINVREISPTTIVEDKNDKFIEIIVYLPTKLADYDEIHNFLIKYIFINTHITFDIQLPDGEPRQQYPATQNIQNWTNNQSVYSYTFQEFSQLIYSLDDQSNSNISTYLQKHFREASNIKRDELLHILENDNLEIIYQRLKHQLKLIRNQSDNKPQIQLPFDRKSRESGLKERLTQMFGIDSFSYKKISGYYVDDNNDVEYPLMTEIYIANVPCLGKHLHLMSSINFSPSLHYNSFYNQSGENIFEWNYNKKNKSSYSIMDLLKDCGYSYDLTEHKKNNNLIFINLISPRIDYLNHSKSDINFKPLASISQDIYKFCKSTTKNKSGIKEESSSSVVNELRSLLKERKNDITNNPQLIHTEPWTQSTVFYLLRPRLINKGMKVDRKYITGLIGDECEKLGCKRHELGIIAAERAQLYFNGQTLGVGFDQLQDLVEKGTDLLIIEKEGIADALAPFANSIGIAILNTRGFLTEYAEDLSQLAQEKGCNIAVITDLDSSGLSIPTAIPDGHRIGIDFSTLDSLGLNPEDVEEKVVSKSDSHLTSLKKSDEYEIPLPYVNSINSEWWKMVLYLHREHKRIEIDSVLAQVGAERFWEFIIEKLGNIFPTRNYNRAIDVPEFVLPNEITNIFSRIQNRFSDIQTPERQNIQNELKDTKGFLNIESEENEINERLMSVCKNVDIKKILFEEMNKEFFSSHE